MIAEKMQICRLVDWEGFEKNVSNNGLVVK